VLRRLRFGSQELYDSGSNLSILQVHASQYPTGWPYQQSARSMAPSDDGYGPAPRPQVDRTEVRPHLCTRRARARVRTHGAGTKDAVVHMVELGGQGPLASSPRVETSPSPSCPLIEKPQHLTVVSFCGEKQHMITDWLRLSIDEWQE